MKITKLAKIACFTLVVAALVGTPAMVRAEDSTNAPAAQTPAPKKHGLPFHGKVASVDATAMTFTVGTMTIAINSATKITKEGKPAVFSDITVGENVAGSYKKDDEGKMTASSVKIGASKKKAAAAASGDAAPAGK